MVQPDLTVVVVNWNTRELLRDCLRSVQEHLAGVDTEVIVVDNASTDGSADMVTAEFPRVRLLRNAENLGFGSANNAAMRVARGGWLLLLNSDVVLTDDSVARLFGRIHTQSDLGVAHCRVRLADGRLQHTTYRFPTLGLTVLEDLGLYKLLGSRAPGILLGQHWDHTIEREVDWVAGVFMLLPRVVFEQTGGFDERLFLYGEDLEWCRRIRDTGRAIRFFPDAEITHHDHASSEMLLGEGRLALCLQRHHNFYRERHGPLAGAAFTTVRLTGAALRAAWYSGRARLGGPRAQAYRDMEPSVLATYRNVRAMAAGRR